MQFRKYKWTIHIGSWSLTQWFKFILVMGVVAAAAAYISGPSAGRTRATEPEPIFSSNEDGSELSGEVSEVIDGDTLDLLNANKPRRIRLYGIDTPELAQPFGPAAKILASEMALHKMVIVRVRGRDKYGRTLGDVVFLDGRVLNQELMKAGMAWWYRKYVNDSQLVALEDEARVRRLGLWSDSDPVAPWDFRAHR
jgi:micrococcal nuclease